jgi:hypothetical protein
MAASSTFGRMALPLSRNRLVHWSQMTEGFSSHLAPPPPPREDAPATTVSTDQHEEPHVRPGKAAAVVVVVAVGRCGRSDSLHVVLPNEVAPFQMNRQRSTCDLYRKPPPSMYGSTAIRTHVFPNHPHHTQPPTHTISTHSHHTHPPHNTQHIPTYTLSHSRTLAHVFIKSFLKKSETTCRTPCACVCVGHNSRFEPNRIDSEDS